MILFFSIVMQAFNFKFYYTQKYVYNLQASTEPTKIQLLTVENKSIIVPSLIREKKKAKLHPKSQYSHYFDDHNFLVHVMM